MLTSNRNHHKEPMMSRDEMKALTTNTLVPVGSVLAAVLLTIATMGYFTGKDGEGAAEISAIKTRLALIEADNKTLHASVDGVTGKLDQLIGSVNDIKVRLGVPPKSP